AFGVGVMVFRSLLTGFLIAGIDETLRRPGPWRAVVTSAARRAIRSFWVVLAFEVGYLAATLVVGNVVGVIFGAQLANLLFIAWLIGGLYLFVYCEIVAVVESAGVRESFVLGRQAAQVPGREHAVLVFGYEVLTIFLTFVVPSRGLVTATPSIAVWVYA